MPLSRLSGSAAATEMGVELKGVVVNTEERRSRVADGIRSRNFTYMEALYRPLIAQNSVVNGFAAEAYTPRTIRLNPTS